MTAFNRKYQKLKAAYPNHILIFKVKSERGEIFYEAMGADAEELIEATPCNLVKTKFGSQAGFREDQLQERLIQIIKSGKSAAIVDR